MKGKKVIAIIMVVVLLMGSISATIIAIMNSSKTKPKEGNKILENRSYSVTAENNQTTNISFNEDGNFEWKYDYADNTAVLSGEYHTYSGKEIERMYNAEKGSEGFTRDDLKTIKEAVQSFVDTKLVSDISDVVYIKMNNLNDTNKEDSQFGNELIFFGMRTDENNFKLKEIESRTIYSFVEN